MLGEMRNYRGLVRDPKGCIFNRTSYVQGQHNGAVGEGADWLPGANYAGQARVVAGAHRCDQPRDA